MWIKICANTNLDDARLAVELGADALGFVFAPSPRRVTAAQVAAITSQLQGAVETIGVFYTLDAEEIAGTVRIAGLTGVQLHGEYTPELVAALAAELPDVKIVQTVHWNTQGQSAVSFAEQVAGLGKAKDVGAVLVDSRTAAAGGGTGVAFDWEAARRLLMGLGKPLVVAGGLHPRNVAQAIAALQPWGVDVASGVEAQPGRKAPVKLAAFLKNARAAAGG